VQASFDTVVYETAAERALFDKLGVVLEAHRALSPFQFREEPEARI
jgi:hypothetical protein